MIISTIVLAFTGIFKREEDPAAPWSFPPKDKETLNRIGEALKRLAGRSVEALAAIVGRVIGAILSSLGKSVGFVPEHKWDLIVFVEGLSRGMIDAKSQKADIQLVLFFSRPHVIIIFRNSR